MSKRKVLSLLLGIGLLAISAAEIFAQADANKPSAEKAAFSIRKMESQVVLYTIYRGAYDNIGQTVGNLFALAGKKGIIPAGQVSYAYLNNPNFVSKEHLLTEIRIAVSKDALGFAGTLGEMTDIKTMPSMEVAVALKPEGIADPSVIYDGLSEFITKQGYVGLDSPSEVFLTNGMGGNYAQMKTEIMIPVKKTADKKN
jgi:effector-binding domain-containing protein